MAQMIEAGTINCNNCGKGGWRFEFTKCHEECADWQLYCDKCIQKYPEAAARLAKLDAQVDCDDLKALAIKMADAVARRYQDAMTTAVYVTMEEAIESSVDSAVLLQKLGMPFGASKYLVRLFHNAVEIKVAYLVPSSRK